RPGARTGQGNRGRVLRRAGGRCAASRLARHRPVRAGLLRGRVPGRSLRGEARRGRPGHRRGPRFGHRAGAGRRLRGAARRPAYHARGHGRRPAAHGRLQPARLARRAVGGEAVARRRAGSRRWTAGPSGAEPDMNQSRMISGYDVPDTREPVEETGGTETEERTAPPHRRPPIGRRRGSRVRARLVMIQAVVVLLLVVLTVRLYDVQIVRGVEFAKAATETRTRDVVVPAVRGQILDSTGRPLVRNRAALVVSVDRQRLTRMPDGGRKVLQRLAAVLGRPVSDVRDRLRTCAPGVPRPCWPGSPYQPIPIDNNVTTRQALAILERQEEFPGVTATV